MASCAFIGHDHTPTPALSNASRLPKEGEENILITSALPYCNNVPHLGENILEFGTTTTSADTVQATLLAVP
jgi:hypothetical protein